MPTTVLCQVMPRRTMSTTMHCADLAALLSGCPCSAREGRNIQPSILHPSILHPYYTHAYYTHTTPIHIHPYYTHPYYTHTTPLQTALHKSSICILSTFQSMQFSLYKKIIKSNDNDQWKMTSTKGGSVQSKCELVLFGCPCVVLRFKIDRSHRTSYIVPSGKYRLVCSHVLHIRGL